MVKKPRWWRTVATVYGKDKDGNDKTCQLATTTDSKALLTDTIDDTNTKIRAKLIEQDFVSFSHAECRCIILNK